MSVIAAFTDGHSTWLGSDTMSTYGDTPFEIGPKWHEGQDGWWIGHVGSHRLNQLIKANASSLTRPVVQVSVQDDIAERMTRLFDEHGCKPVFQPDNCTPNWINGFVLARPGEIYDFDPNMAYAKFEPWQMVARGSGADFALGAFFALKGEHNGNWGVLSQSFVMYMAMEAAGALNIHVGGRWIKELITPEERDRRRANPPTLDTF